MPDIPESYETLSAMIAPALFLTANGSLIISTSNRMARIVDRIRVVNDQYDQLVRGKTDHDFVEERAGHCQAQLLRLAGRNDRIRYALMMLYFAFCTFAGASLMLAVDVLTGHRIGGLPTALAIVGVTSMLGAAVNLLLEALAALRTYRLESAFYRDLQERRQAIHPGRST